MNDDAPLEWWEEIQLRILEGLGEPVAHLREWRELRAASADETRRIEANLSRLVEVIEQPKKWWSHHKDTHYQVLGHMLMEAGAEIPEPLRERIIRAAREGGDWRDRPLDEPDDGSYDPERRASLDKIGRAHV